MAEAEVRATWRQQLIVDHMPLAEAIATRIAKSRSMLPQREDLVAFAMIGLCEAADRFDSERQVQFPTYASYYVEGAVFHGMRETLCRLPYNIYLLVKEQVDAGEEPISFVELDAVLGLEGLGQGRSIFDEVALRELVRKALNGLGLTDREKEVFALRYLYHLSQNQVGSYLGQSSCTAGRVEREALDKLKEKLA